MSSKQLPRSAMFRKRGRPAGTNRVPLSLDERRTRNTEYERLRRVNKREALAELATATGLSDDLTLQDLLAEVILFIRTSATSDAWDADRLRRCNDNLASQITMLEHRLATERDPRTTDLAAFQPPLPALHPAKRKMEECVRPSPPSKRFAPDQGIYDPTFSCFPEQEYYQEAEQLQSWPASEFQCSSAPETVQQSHSSWHERTFPLTCNDRRSPTSHSEASSSDMKLLPTSDSTSASCCDSTQLNMEGEDLVAVWTEALNEACGEQLMLDQIASWMTEEDLVSLDFE